MDTFKEVLSFVGAVVSLIAALIPLFAYLADRRKRGARAYDQPRVSSNPADEPSAHVAQPWTEPRTAAVPMIEPAAFERARETVRRPAIVMFAVACLGLFTNLVTAGAGFVDQFVTPLGINVSPSPELSALYQGPPPDRAIAYERAQAERGSAVMGMITIFGFSLASAVSMWSAYSMLNMRNYWLAVAGSVAVMPGACLCCFAGVPAGIWSIVVLLRPEVSAAFR